MSLTSTMDTFPLIYRLIVQILLPRGRLKILDLGCGKGAAARALKSEKYAFTGVDIFDPYVKECRKSGLYAKVLKKDLLKINSLSDVYDVTLIFQVLEHLKKSDSVKLIKNAEKLSKKAVIVSVPNGDCDQEEYDKNPYQKHNSTWNADDFKKLGFKVYGQGLGFVYSNESYGSGKKMALWQMLMLPLSLILSPIILFIPSLSAQIIAVKYIKQKD